MRILLLWARVTCNIPVRLPWITRIAIPRSMKKLLFVFIGITLIGFASASASELIRNGTFVDGISPWKFSKQTGFPATVQEDPENQGVIIAVDQAGEKSWHVQLLQEGVQFEGKTSYRLTFRAKADHACKMSVKLVSLENTAMTLWLRDVALTSEWQSFDFEVVPRSSAVNGRFSFTGLAAQPAVYSIGSVSLELVPR